MTATEFQNVIKAQLEGSTRFAKLGGELELQDRGGMIGLYFVKDVDGHTYTHSLNAERYTKGISPGHTIYGEYQVAMVTRYPKKFHPAPVDQATGLLTLEGAEVVLKHLKSGLAKFTKNVRANDAFVAARGLNKSFVVL